MLFVLEVFALALLALVPELFVLEVFALLFFVELAALELQFFVPVVFLLSAIVSLLIIFSQTHAGSKSRSSFAILVFARMLAIYT